MSILSTMTTLASSATQNSSSSSEGTMSTTPLATTTSEATSPITTPRTTEESTERSNGMDGGYIAAIAVGAVVVVVIVIVFLVVLIRRRRRKQKKPPPELPHPYPQAAALSMHPTLQQNGQRMPLTSQSSSGSIVADMPSEAYEDPETAAPRAVIQDIPKGSTKSQVYQNINRPSTQDMSDGVYVEPLGHRPPSERQPQGRAGKITSDSTYIAMGACGPPPSPQGEPTPPDQLDKEGERDEVYTVPNIHGAPPPIPCNGSKGPGYVNLPSPAVDGTSLDDEQPLDDYQNVQTAVSPYRNISAGASPQQPFSQVRRQLSSPASDPTAKKALKPPMPGNHGQRTPPKTSPKPAISPAHAFRSQSPALPSDNDSRPQSPKIGSAAALAAVLTAENALMHSARKKKPAGASSSVHSPRPQPGTATDEESSDNESYENIPGTEQKRHYQNVPKKNTDPKHANRQQNNSSTSSSESASTRQRPPGARNRYQQMQQYPGALSDEFKKRMNRPKNLSTRKLETTTVAKPYTIDESSGHVPVLPASTSLNSGDDEPRALSRNRSRDKNESTDKTKHEGSSVYSSSSPKPPLSVLVSLELSIPLTELETDGQILGHKHRLSKSDTALSQMGAAHPAMPRRSSSVHNVGHRNTLRHNLKSKVPDTEVLEPHSLDPKKNPSVGSPPPPISRKFWESSSTVSSVGGTVQKPDSGVILNVPHDAVDKDAKIDVLTAVCTDMDRVRRILNLPGDECVSSPLAEYWAGHEFCFKKSVSITLPTFLPPNPDLQLVRVYRVAHRCDGQLAITRLRPREEAIHAVHLSDEQTDSDPHVPTTSRKGPKGQATDYADNLPWETDGFFWLSSDDQVIIKTNHFCGYVCTYCNLQQGPPVLKAIVCGSHTREEEGQHSSQITLYIWDKRLDIKDFQQDNGIDSKQIVGDRSISLRAFPDQLQTSKVHVRLVLVGQDKEHWQHVMDGDGDPAFPPEQHRDLGQFLSCNNEMCDAAKAAFTCPLYFDWWLESKPGCQPGSVLKCVVDIVLLKPDDPPIWSSKDTSERLRVQISRQRDPSESCTQADSRQSSSSPRTLNDCPSLCQYHTPSSPPEHVPTWMETTRMYGQPHDHPVPQNCQGPQNNSHETMNNQNNSHETMNNQNIGDSGSLTSSAADSHGTPAKIVARGHSVSSPEGAVGGLRHPREHATQDPSSGIPYASTSLQFSGGPSQSGHQSIPEIGIPEMSAEFPPIAQSQAVAYRNQGDAMPAEHCGHVGGDSHTVNQYFVFNHHHYNKIGKIQGNPTFASTVTNHSGPRIENNDHTSMHALPYTEGSTGGAQSFQSPGDEARQRLELHGDFQDIGQPELGYSDPSINPQRGMNLTDMRNPVCSPSH